MTLISADERETDEKTLVTLDPTVNDEDPQEEPLRVVRIEQPRVGTATRTDNEVTYTPDPLECDKIRSVNLRKIDSM